MIRCAMSTMTDYSTIESAALSMSALERAHLAQVLSTSVDCEASREREQKWAVLEERVNECVESGKMRCEEASIVLDRIEARLAGKS